MRPAPVAFFDPVTYWLAPEYSRTNRILPLGFSGSTLYLHNRSFPYASGSISRTTGGSIENPVKRTCRAIPELYPQL